jgi:hypothetical protein
VERKKTRESVSGEKIEERRGAGQRARREKREERARERKIP